MDERRDLVDREELLMGLSVVTGIYTDAEVQS